MNEEILFELEGGAVESADELYAGATVNKEGYYHVECVEVKMNQPDEGKQFTPNVALTLHVLAGDHPDQVEKMIYHRINLKKFNRDINNFEPLDEKAIKNIRCLCYAFGLINNADLANPHLKINFAGLLNKQAVVKVSHQDPYEYTDGEGNKKMAKERWNIAWHNDIYHVADERVKDAPKDMQMVGLALQEASPEQMNKQMDNLLSGI